MHAPEYVIDFIAPLPPDGIRPLAGVVRMPAQIILLEAFFVLLSPASKLRELCYLAAKTLCMVLVASERILASD